MIELAQTTREPAVGAAPQTGARAKLTTISMKQPRTTLWSLIKGMGVAPGFRWIAWRYGSVFVVIALLMAAVREFVAAGVYALLGGLPVVVALLMQWRAEQDGTAAAERREIAERKAAREPQDRLANLGWAVLVVGLVVFTKTVFWLVER